MNAALIDGDYRYWLRRTWQADTEHLPIIMLNPSTADADADDPTIRRCVAFAKRQGYGGLFVANLYALRSTDPAQLWLHPDPVGPRNDEELAMLFDGARLWDRTVLCAWGANARPERVARVRELAAGVELLALGTTKAGAPRHPLYVRGDTPMEAWA